MTKPQARAEAIRRWGRGGQVFDRETDAYRDPTSGKLADAVYHSIKTVGRYWVGCQFRMAKDGGHVFGNGHTWAEAFAAANEKEMDPPLRSISDEDVAVLEYVLSMYSSKTMTHHLLEPVVARLKDSRKTTEAFYVATPSASHSKESRE